MTFVFEYIATGSPIEQTTEYKQAIEFNQGMPVGSRIVDQCHNHVLYCLSVESNQERPPGSYLFYYNGVLIRVRAYLTKRWKEGVGRVALFRIYSLEIPEDTKTEEENITCALVSALDVAGRGASGSIAAVDVEFI